MNLYTVLSIGYDLLDRTWFSDNGINPRDVVGRLISDKKCMVLDMCCGTFSNGMPIAVKNPCNRVIGLDRSKEMLRGAGRKIRKAGLENAKLICRDATDSGLKDSSFDYIIIGLVLHECTDELREKILREAYRLLKNDGRLIILEWDRQTRVSRKIRFAPLYAAECLVNPKYFRSFYNADKKEFFEQYGFITEEMTDCNYSVVMSMRKI